MLDRKFMRTFPCKFLGGAFVLRIVGPAQPIKPQLMIKHRYYKRKVVAARVTSSLFDKIRILMI